MTRLDFAHATIRRLKEMNGIPWNKLLIVLSLARGPLAHGELQRLLTGGKWRVGGPITNAVSEGIIRHLKDGTYELTEQGEAMVAEILNPPAPQWPAPKQTANA